MKAARLYQPGKPLQIEQIPDPILKESGAIVRVLSSHVPPFTARVLSGELGYALPPLPFTPCESVIGLVEAVGDDVVGIKVGQIVFCDPHIYSPRHFGAEPDGILIGWTGLATASHRMQSLWKDGGFAQKALWPAECLTPLPDAESMKPEQLALLNYLTVSYGGLLRGDLHAGQTLIVNGATGALGALAVVLALAMGVSKIVAVGRDRETLEKLVQLDTKRVTTVQMQGNFSDDSKRIAQAANGADMVLDVLGGVTNPEPTIACINALRPAGTAVFVGGVQVDIPLPYSKIMVEELNIRGSFMYPKHVTGEQNRLMVGGSRGVTPFQIHTFSLDKVNEAVAKAATLKGFEQCVVMP